MANLRQSSNVQCQRSKKDLPCIPSQQVCLFNILNDPCEFNNLLFKFPDVTRIMERTYEMYKATEIPRGNKPIDPRADPKFYKYTWTNWWDMVEHENDETEMLDKQFIANPENIFH